MTTQQWEGTRHNGQTLITLNGVELVAALHGPNAFPDDLKYDWGNSSAGAMHAAMGILMCVIPVTIAFDLADAFLFECVSKLPRDHWTMTRQDVVAWLLTKYVTWELAVGGPGTILEVDDPDDGSLNSIKRPATM